MGADVSVGPRGDRPRDGDRQPDVHGGRRHAGVHHRRSDRGPSGGLSSDRADHRRRIEPPPHHPRRSRHRLAHARRSPEAWRHGGGGKCRSGHRGERTRAGLSRNESSTPGDRDAGNGRPQGAQSGTPASRRTASWHRRTRAVDRVRKRGQPAPLARRRTPQGNRRQACARRIAHPRRPPIAGRKLSPGVRRRSGGPGARLSRRALSLGCRAVDSVRLRHPAGVRRPARRTNVVVYAPRLTHDHHRVRSRSGAAEHERRSRVCADRVRQPHEKPAAAMDAARCPGRVAGHRFHDRPRDRRAVDSAVRRCQPCRSRIPDRSRPAGHVRSGRCGLQPEPGHRVLRSDRGTHERAARCQRRRPDAGCSAHLRISLDAADRRRVRHARGSRDAVDPIVCRRPRLLDRHAHAARARPDLQRSRHHNEPAGRGRQRDDGPAVLAESRSCRRYGPARSAGRPVSGSGGCRPRRQVRQHRRAAAAGHLHPVCAEEQRINRHDHGGACLRRR